MLVVPLPVFDAAVAAAVEAVVEEAVWLDPAAEVNDASSWSSTWPGSVEVPADAVVAPDCPVLLASFAGSAPEPPP